MRKTIILILILIPIVLSVSVTRAYARGEDRFAMTVNGEDVKYKELKKCDLSKVMELLANNRLGEAGDLLERGLRYNPEAKDLYLSIGAVRLMQRDFVRAESHLLQAMEYDPENRLILIYLADAKCGLDKVEECKALLRQARQGLDGEMDYIDWKLKRIGSKTKTSRLLSKWYKKSARFSFNSQNGLVVGANHAWDRPTRKVTKDEKAYDDLKFKQTLARGLGKQYELQFDPKAPLINGIDTSLMEEVNLKSKIAGVKFGTERKLFNKTLVAATKSRKRYFVFVQLEAQSGRLKDVRIRYDETKNQPYLAEFIYPHKSQFIIFPTPIDHYDVQYHVIKNSEDGEAVNMMRMIISSLQKDQRHIDSYTELVDEFIDDKRAELGESAFMENYYSIEESLGGSFTGRFE